MPGASELVHAFATIAPENRANQAARGVIKTREKGLPAAICVRHMSVGPLTDEGRPYSLRDFHADRVDGLPGLLWGEQGTKYWIDWFSRFVQRLKDRGGMPDVFHNHAENYPSRGSWPDHVCVQLTRTRQWSTHKVPALLGMTCAEAVEAGDYTPSQWGVIVRRLANIVYRYELGMIYLAGGVDEDGEYLDVSEYITESEPWDVVPGAEYLNEDLLDGLGHYMDVGISAVNIYRRNRLPDVNAVELQMDQSARLNPRLAPWIAVPMSVNQWTLDELVDIMTICRQSQVEDIILFFNAATPLAVREKVSEIAQTVNAATVNSIREAVER
jgi:hypothetical protein